MYSTSLSFDSVVVIESLEKGELKTGRNLLETTLQPVSIADPGFVCELYEPANRREFLDVLREVARSAREYGRSPIVHFETHGGKDGVCLANHEQVPWGDIAPLLSEINTISRMNLLVVAAMCHGWYMSHILRPSDRSPAFGIVGAEQDMPAASLLTVMQRFYGRLLQSPHDLQEALIAANMAPAAGEWRFEMMGAELLLCKVFNHYLTTLRSEETPAARANRLVAEIARARGLDVRQTMEVRQDVMAKLDDHRYWYEYYRNQFLMLDLYPENLPRFAMNYDECMSLVAQNR